jgi:hypothetical protein
MQYPATTTAATRKNDFYLLVSLHQSASSSAISTGELYVDDGESLDSVSASKFSRIKFEATQAGVTMKPTVLNHLKFLNPLKQVGVYGIMNGENLNVRVNGVVVPFTYDSSAMVRTKYDI